MKLLQKVYTGQPLASSLLIVLICVCLMHSIKIFDQLSPMTLEFSISLVRLLISSILITFLLKLGLGRKTLITTPYNLWGKHWYLSLMPISVIAVINLTGVDFDSLNYSITNVALWIFSNVSIGLVEEILMRGVVFYILYKAWGVTKKGVFAAVIVQALVFGLAHYSNLQDMSFIDVTFMVINATLIGIGFAGLMLVTRTIWLPIILHIIFDLIARMNELLLPGFKFPIETAIELHIVSVIIVFLFVALPGLLFTKKAISISHESG